MQTEAFIPLVTHPEPNSDVVAANAVKMASILGADIHALAINADIPPVSNALSRLLLDVPEMIRQAEEKSRDCGNRLLAAIKKEAERSGVNATINAIAPKIPHLADAAAIHARYYDYVLCSWEKDNPTSISTAEAVIFGSGRPTILLPEASPIDKIDHVAIAWDGSRVAARATGDAHQLLQRAAKISVLTISGEKPLQQADAAERMVQGLRKRGMTAETHVVDFRGPDIATLLQDQAVQLGAGLMVMGAFGHSRARDFILGGATRGILNDLRLPVLLSH